MHTILNNNTLNFLLRCCDEGREGIPAFLLVFLAILLYFALYLLIGAVTYFITETFHELGESTPHPKVAAIMWPILLIMLITYPIWKPITMGIKKWKKSIETAGKKSSEE